MKVSVGKINRKRKPLSFRQMRWNKKAKIVEKHKGRIIVRKKKSVDFENMIVSNLYYILFKFSGCKNFGFKVNGTVNGQSPKGRRFKLIRS